MHQTSYKNAAYFVSKYLQQYKDKNLKILDVGSQDVNGTYKPLFSNENWSYCGCDMCEGKNVNIVLKNVYRWNEIPAESYDVVISGQAFEHIEYIWKTVLEVRRVLKEGGIFCMIAPAACHEHRYPLDCWRIFSDGAAAIAKYAMLEVLEVYTKWDEASPDGNIIDTVLVCKKNKLTLRQEAGMAVRMFAERFVQ